jgi:hypothetical protein
MIRRLLLAFALATVSAPAFAACPLSVKDGAGAAQNISCQADGSGSYMGNVVPNAGAAGGATAYHLISAASTNATSVKGSAGTLYAITAYNNANTIAYLKFSDASAAPTCGTTGVTQTFLIPANSNGSGFNFSIPVGLAFASGIAFCITGGIADTDTTAIGASTVVVSLAYK